MPFTVEQFFEVFEAYNRATGAWQWLLWCAAGLVLVLMAIRASGWVVNVLLAAMWLWTGIVYHIVFLWPINPLAIVFGSAFIVEALVLLAAAPRSRYRPGRDAASVFGGVLLVYGLVLYPMLGEYLGHAYPRRPSAGTPCPTTIFTFAVLLFLERRPRPWVYMIPLLWSLVGATAAYLFGVWEDLGLLAAVVVGSVLLILKKDDLAGPRIEA